MKITTTIEFKDEGAIHVAKRIANSLAPDNLTNMYTEVKDDSVCIHISTEKITSLIATVDDLLMNAKLAEEIAEDLEK
ncbi:KEOPS complex subunit Pcc1 [Methanolobus sediminis]|uniref:KEOPS complex subunit Pcc1 n=1 Tax=Methanolobus sediminis TaxID=3072978 RepID=A0AA51UJ96_9EURY|nr:KEOPS complex subunit Pcc1 [Methanolobus sediminis]WMW24534.1 KEOPS complex subunit Pcc1 [Methanolobus sediminis]